MTIVRSSILPMIGAGLCLCACAGTGGRPGGQLDVEPASVGTIVSPDRFHQPDLPPPSDIRTADGRPGPGYWQNKADYAIEAALDEPSRTITGRETIRYTNNSPLPLDHLWIALDQNLYRTDSEGALITKPTARFGAMSFDGGVTLGAVSIEGHSVTPLVYGTIARIDLPVGVSLGPKGGQIAISIAWSFKVPEHGSDRMGIAKGRDGEVFEIAQWFPQVCKYDDVRAWNTLPYLGQGEFYTDFGDYDVQITVPRSHLVAATGELTNADQVLTSRQIERLSAARASSQTGAIRTTGEIGDASSRPAGDGPLTWKFRSRMTRTFAWASSAAFAWEACAATIKDKPAEAPAETHLLGELGATPGSVLCQAFYPSEAAGLWSSGGEGGGAVQMLRASIETYSSHWYPYPYGSASTINGAVGGMEYPGLIFCSEREQERGLWGVTTHEIGHTWFPMVVNTDERRHAWMDEGFNSLINYFASHERYGDPAGDPGASHNPRPSVFASRNPRGLPQPIETPADLNTPPILGTLQYRKTACGLLILREGVLGPERFDAAFREYIHRWAFKSPQPADFFRTIEDISGLDLGWFWRAWFFDTSVVDQAVTTVMQPEGESRNARVTFKNLGAVMPVWYRVEYTDGTTEDRTLPVYAWAWSDSFEAAFDTHGRQVRRVVIDPDGKLPDVNPANNVWSR